MRLSAAFGICFAALAATAGTSPAATISGTYFEDEVAINCSGNTNLCVGLMPVLPSSLTGKFLEISQVSCAGNVPNKIRNLSIYITDAGLNARRFHYIPNGDPTAASNVVVLASIRFKVAGGPPRQIAMAAAMVTVSTASIQCRVVGEILDQ